MAPLIVKDKVLMGTAASSAMCSRFREALMRRGVLYCLLVAIAATMSVSAHAEQEIRRLRVCADPNNLPFSNEREEGFENKIASLIARELDATLEYTWWAQRRGFIRNTLQAGKCDLVMAVPARFEMALATRPYYRSTYVFVLRKDRAYDLRSLDDPVLRKLRIGVQIIGDDYSNTPPAHALARRHIVENVVGYTVYGDYSQPAPQARIIEAVARSEADVAFGWGPLAGYFSKAERFDLDVVPIQPAFDPPDLPMQYDISMGVRRGEEDLKRKIETVLERRAGQIRKILRDYGVPLVEGDDSGI